MLRILKSIGFILAVASLSGCIEVKDIGEQWDKGLVDTALEGKWSLKSTNPEDNKADPSYVIFKNIDDDHYEVTTIEEEEEKKEGLARTVKAGDRTFLLLTDPAYPPSGKMWPYEFRRDQLYFFIADEGKEFSIETLNDESLNEAVKAFNGPPKWNAGVIGTKVE